VSDAASAPIGGLLSGPPAYRPATPWQAGPALLATALIVVAAMAAMAVAMLLVGASGGHGRPAGPAETFPVGYLWAFAVMQVVAIVLTLLASRLFGGRVRDVLALRGPPSGWRAYGGAILLMASFQVLLAGIQYFLLRHDIFTDLWPVTGLVTGPHWLLAAAVLAVGAPVSEELLFRGFLLSALAQSLEKGLSVLAASLFPGLRPGALARRRLGFWPAALVSTAAWTVLHYGYSPTGLVEVFAIGLLFSWLLWRTGSLRVLIFCHAVYNGAIVLGLRLVDLPAGG
jgi:membrane protease YdiL (CAAX protease family)